MTFAGLAWQNWGSRQATADTNALFGGPGEYHKVTVVAFDLGECDGVIAYRAVEWPGSLEAFDPTSYFNLCTGQGIGKGWPTTSGTPMDPTATFAGESEPGTWTGVEPTTIWFSADSGNIVGSIRWTAWTDQSAVGSGTWGYDDCLPSCAGGKVTDYPATIELSAPSHGQFTSLTEIQSGPYGHTHNFTLPSRVVRATSDVTGVWNSSAKCPNLVVAPGSQIMVEGTCPAGATALQIVVSASHATGQVLYNGGIGKDNVFFIPVTMPYMGEPTAGINAECQPGSAVVVEATIEYASPPSA